MTSLEAEPQTSSARPLGLWSAIALVVGSMIGSGVFLLPASLAPYGAASLLGWGITLCGAILLALTFCKLSARWPQTGGPYVYARNGFGDVAGFVIAWSYWISVWCANAAIAVAFAGSIGAVFPPLTATPLRSAMCALGALWICTAVNLAGVREAGRVQLLTTVLKLVPLLLFAVVALWFVDTTHYVPFNRSGEPMGHVVQATVALTLWAFLGLEAATIPAGAITDASRTIPRATIFGTLLAGVATILACTVVLGLLPGDVLKDSQAPMADAASSLWGPGAGIALAVVATISTFGALNGWVLVSGQVPLAAAQDGMLPKPFARLHANGTPVFGVVASSVLASLLVMANFSHSLVELFTFSILLSTAATLLPYVVSSAAWLRTGERNGRILAALALLYSLYALVGTGSESLLWGGALLLAGLPVFAFMRYRAATA
ncbi:amino acid permease [Lysobacter helvus]|uniref:Arginine/agmatine antiporter n=2 Tax=Lysobacteraceae TaxID=32033 RepID=A0ABM7Q236_9GAMM|nr:MULTISPECIES: amino acid permease [Lysobacter]BCT91312.1 amino acid permease [Lysobacter caseinilyticus]BCT94465.1 amino acid permease [Lysobacter helvus]